MLLLTGMELMAQANSVAGVWRLHVSRSIDLMEPSYRAKFDTLSSDAKDRAVNAMNGREFAFLQDGSISVSWTSRSGPRVSKGSWEIDNPSGDLLVTIGQRKVGFSYEFPSETTLILRAKEKKAFFNNLYFEKIN
jgi:hypothetical protein